MMASSKSVPVQQKLYELGKPALQLVRFVGYLPFTISNNYELTSSYRSIPLLWASFLCSVAVLKVVNYSILSPDSTQMIGLDKVQVFCQLMLALTGIISVIVLTIKGILTMKQGVRFWEKNCSQLHEFVGLDPSFDFCVQSNEHYSLFPKVARETRIGCMFICFYGIVTPVVVFTTNTTPTGVKLTSVLAGFHGNVQSWVSVAITTLLRASMAFSYLYMGLSAYLTFYLKLYGLCFKMIVEKLKKLTAAELGNPNLQLCEKPLGCLYCPYIPFCIHDTREVAISTCLGAYQLIEELVSEFNAHFSFELVFEALRTIISVLIYAFFVTTRGIDRVSTLITLGPAFALCIRFYSLATAATEVRSGGEAIACQLHRLDIDKITAGTRAKVDAQISNQILGNDFHSNA